VRDLIASAHQHDAHAAFYETAAIVYSFLLIARNVGVEALKLLLRHR